MAEVPSYKEWILEAIDQLRKRKARPDLDRICHMLERRHGLGFAQVQQQLQALVQAEVVVKVDYKGSTSYRNAAKWIKTVGRNAAVGQVQQQIASGDVNATVGQALRKLKSGATSARETEKQLASESNSSYDQPDSTSWKEVPAVRKGKLQQDHSSAPRNYEKQTTEVAAGRRDVAAAADADSKLNLLGKVKAKDKDLSKKVEDAETSTRKPKDVEERRYELPPRTKRAASPMPVGRPASRRKRVKKYHGPDFIDSSSLPSPEGLDAEDPCCDFCFLPSAANPKGESEDLLRCIDCNAKAHPSCMDYSPELAKRSHLSTWQCMDCKPCSFCQTSLCQTSGNGDCMVFCDSCDRGYHMKCHNPKVIEKPTGKWLCYKCVPEPKVPKAKVPEPDVQSQVANPTVPQRGRPRKVPKPVVPVPSDANPATAGLPTPCDSPVSDLDSSPECDDKANAILNRSEMDQYPVNIPDAKDWTIHDVAKFFTAIGFPEQAPAFKDQEIDGKSLLLMKRSDVLTGLSIRLGPALKIYNHIKRLQTGLPDGHLAVH